MNQAHPLEENYHRSDREYIPKLSFGFLILMAILTFLPLERFIFPLSLKLVDPIFIVLLGYVLLLFIRDRKIIQFPLALSIWIILIASALAIITAPPNINNIIAFIQELYIFAWFVALTNILILFRQIEVEGLLKFWSLVAILEAVTSLMGMFKIGPAMFYTSPIKLNVLDTGVFNRGFGTFANPNSTGAYLAISLFVFLAAGWPVWMRIILGLFLFAGVFSTGSMGAILGTTISFVVLVSFYFAIKKPRRVFLIAGMLGILIAVVVASIIFIYPNNILLQMIANKKANPFLALTLGRLIQSFSSRETLVSGAWQVFENYPLGLGPNVADAHNDYIAFLFDRGPLGLLGWLTLVATTLIAPVKNIFQKKDESRLWQLMALWAGFLAVSILAFTHEISHFRQVWVLLAFLYATNTHFSLGDVSAKSRPIVKIEAGANRNKLLERQTE